VRDPGAAPQLRSAPAWPSVPASAPSAGRQARSRPAPAGPAHPRLPGGVLIIELSERSACVPGRPGRTADREVRRAR